MRGFNPRASRMQKVHPTILATSQQFLHGKILNVPSSTVKMKNYPGSLCHT